MQRKKTSKTLPIFCILLVFCTPVCSQTPEAYFEKYRHIAVEHEQKYGVPACIILAQAALETGYGKSYLARVHNNHFGIRARHGYRRYDTAESSFVAHSVLLTTQARYKSLFELNASDYKGWAHGLQRCGYATDSLYAEKLVWIIERYKLNKL